MPTVNQCFAELLSRIELNPSRVALATQRFDSIKKTLEAVLPGARVTRIGSFQRQTKIRPIDLGDALDIDVLVCLGSFFGFVSPPRTGITTVDALAAVRSALRSNEIYRVMDPRPDAPTVVLEYADPKKLTVELVPAYEDRTGNRPRLGGPPCYLVPTSRGVWEPADYDYDAAYISASNQQLDVKQSLVPSIKILKSFLRRRDISLKSFHVEVLAAQIIPEALQSWRGYSWGYQHVLTYFLATAGAKLAKSTFLTSGSSLPGSHTPPVDSGVPTRLRDIGAALQQLAAVAQELCRRGDDERCIEEWSEFVGAPFPAASWRRAS